MIFMFDASEVPKLIPRAKEKVDEKRNPREVLLSLSLHSKKRNPRDATPRFFWPPPPPPFWKALPSLLPFPLALSAAVRLMPNKPYVHRQPRFLNQ